MDSGAHYHACDFQVHSPRDRNWTGPTPTDEVGRSDYAKRFVAACRARGLHAVAITDHHDVLFVEYIRAAAAAEVLEDGTPVTVENRLVIFPGIELTLALPCQALLLFDPECTPAELAAALAILGIVPSPATDAKTCETQRLAAELSPMAICERLSNNAALKNRFILLPNVNAGGGDTILRSGFARHYVDMPCIGGYVDGSMAGHGKRLIIDGKDPQWGSKRIGVFQTSDNRRDDFADLGKHRTWIKWSKPSAEALRQACLAPTSRIAYSDPSIPASWIRKMRVSASRYFGAFEVDFNPQTNMVIGGRGSGKSTLLEYLRWGLCDQPVSTVDDGSEEVPNYERRRGSLIKSTLQRTHGTITIEYVIGGVLHTIRRDAETEKVYLSIKNSVEEEVSPSVIQGLARLQGYSQKQLSNVSVRRSELLRLVTSPLKSELDLIESETTQSATRLRAAYQEKEAHRSLTTQHQSTSLELNSKQLQLDGLRAEMGALAPEHKQAIQEHGDYSKGERLLSSFDANYGNLIADLEELAAKLEQRTSELQPVSSAAPVNALVGLRQSVSDVLANARNAVLGLRDATSAAQTSAQHFRDDARNLLDEHLTRYEAATSQNAAIQSRLDQMKTLSNEVDTLASTLEVLDAKLGALGLVDERMEDARAEWSEIAEREFAVLSAQATNLTAASKGDLRVSVEKGKNTDHLADAFVAAIQGANITRDKVLRLLEPVKASAQPLEEWLGIVNEVLHLIEAEQAGAVAITPKLAAAGFGHAELKRIAIRLTGTAAFELSLLKPETQPSFAYRAPDATYMPFEQASPGQQANALLSLLFGQAVGPLLIDQPEDDLDNATALQIAESIWSAKEKRQLIVATHNPNLLVIGDAELVMHCSHSVQTQVGHQVGITVQGGLDTRAVCDVVAGVMEGGREAFRLRMSRYGF